MLTLSYLHTTDRRRAAERIFEGNYGTRWAHQRARKEEGCKEGH